MQAMGSIGPGLAGLRPRNGGSVLRLSERNSQA